MHATDLALAIALAFLQAAVGFAFGGRPWSWALGVVAFLGPLTAYLAICPWFLMDYDNFHGEIYAGALVFDHLFLLAQRPYTSISIVFYFAALSGLLAVLRRPDT